MTVFLTIMAGVSTFVIGQILLKLIIDPVNGFKKTTSQIAHYLSVDANIYANPRTSDNERQAEVSRKMRELSAALYAHMYLIPAYNKVRLLFGLPERRQVVEAHRNLVALSNGYDGPLANQGILNCYSAQRLREALGIHIPEGERLNPEHEKDSSEQKSPLGQRRSLSSEDFFGAEVTPFGPSIAPAIKGLQPAKLALRVLDHQCV